MDYRDSDFDTFPDAPDGSRFNAPMLLVAICVVMPLCLAGVWHLVVAILKASAP